MVGLQAEAAFPDWFSVPNGFGVEGFERVEEFKGTWADNSAWHGGDWVLGTGPGDDEVTGWLLF